MVSCGSVCPLQRGPGSPNADVELSAAAEGRYRRQLLRHPRRRSLSLDGSPERAGIEAVDRRREHRHVHIPGRAAAAQHVEGADHGAVRLSTGVGTAVCRPALVLQPQHRSAAAVGRLHARDAQRAGNGRHRSQSVVAGRIDRVVGDGSGAGWPALRLRAIGRRIRLVDVLRARAGDGTPAARRDSLGEIQQPGLDRRRQRLLLRPLSGAASRAGARGGGTRQENLLSRARHAAVGRPPDLRTEGRAGAIHQRRPR